MASPEQANGWGAFTLGVADTTPLEMANAYATLAADGQYCEPLPVPTHHRPGRRRPARRRRSPRRAATRRSRPDVARAAVDAARCVTGYGAAARQLRRLVHRAAVSTARSAGRSAGKTGTTDDTRAAWFVGFTPDLAAASFIADPDNPFHVAGDGNSWKPIQTVSGLLREAGGTPDRVLHPAVAHDHVRAVARQRPPAHRPVA